MRPSCIGLQVAALLSLGARCEASLAALRCPFFCLTASNEQVLGPRSCEAAQRLMRVAMTPQAKRKLKAYDALHTIWLRVASCHASWWSPLPRLACHPSQVLGLRTRGPIGGCSAVVRPSPLYALLTPRHGILCEPEPARSDIAQDIVEWLTRLN